MTQPWSQGADKQYSFLNAHNHYKLCTHKLSAGSDFYFQGSEGQEGSGLTKDA